MKRARILIGILALTLLTGMVGGCAELAPSPAPSTSPAMKGTIDVYVTDAPPKESVTSIMVTVKEILVHIAGTEQEQSGSPTPTASPTPESSPTPTPTDTPTPTATPTPTSSPTLEQEKQGGEWVTIELDEAASTFDLLQVKGIEQFSGTAEVPAGKYTQVRLVIEDVKVKLGDGELQDASVPSGEIKIAHPFKVIGGETTALVIDFEADKMVNITGNGKITVKPVIKLTTREGQTSQKNKEKPADKEAEEALVDISYDEFAANNQITRDVEVKVGDSFTIALSSNRTTGFEWSETATISDTSVLKQTDHKFVPPKGKDGKPPVVGASGKEIWTFEALKAGTSTVSMEYGQPWEGGEKGTWAFTLNVTVS